MFLGLWIPMIHYGQQDTISQVEASLSKYEPGEEFGASIVVSPLKIRSTLYRYASGTRTLSLWKRDLERYQNANLGEILSQTTPVFVKNYGPGALATPSLRGTGSAPGRPGNRS